MTRKEKVVKFTKEMFEGGWSSMYSFVDEHVTDDELDEMEDEDE